MSSSLAANVGVVGALEGADAVRLQAVRLPDPLHRAQARCRRPGHRPAGPMGRLAGRLGAGQRDHPVHGGVGQRRLARLAGRVAQQAVDPGFGEALLPAPHRRPADPGAPRHLGGAAIGPPMPERSEPASRASERGYDRRRSPPDEHDPRPRRKGRRDEPCPQHAHPPALVNPMIVSVH